MKLRLTPRALQDVNSICDYVNERNPAAAVRIREAVEAALRLLAEYPNAGALRRENIRRFVLPRYPFLIFYSVDAREQEVQVLTIRHASRREEQ